MARLFLRRFVSTVRRAYSHDPLECIESIGGEGSERKRWKLSQAAAIDLIEAGTEEFFVQCGASQVKLVVVRQGGEKYLRTARRHSLPEDLFLLMAEKERASGPLTKPAPVIAARSKPAVTPRANPPAPGKPGGPRKPASRLKQWLLTPA